MSKNIIFPYITYNRFVDEPLLKKLSLFYDKILVSESRFNILEEASEKEFKFDYIELHYEYSVWQYLNENKVVSKYNNFNDNNDSSEDIKELQDLMMSVIRNNRTDVPLPLMEFYLSHDILARIDTLKFRKSDELNEYYPSLRNFGTFSAESKKNQVIQFVLNDIPEPNNSTSWEQIIEYRSDLDVKNKYLALMNWVNKVSNSNMKLSEIKDEYDFLYNDYMKQFKLHKMKFNNSKLEIILNASANFIANIATGNYTTSMKDFFQFNVKNAQLLQEEAKLPGKEIAYIYHTSLKFGNI